MLEYLRKRPMLISAVACTASAVCGFYCKTALIVLTIVFTAGLVLAAFRKNSSMMVALSLTLIMSLSCFITLKQSKELSLLAGDTASADICYCATTYKSAGYCVSEFEVISSAVLPKGTKLALSHNPFYAECGETIRAEISLEEMKDRYKASNYSNGIYLSGRIESFKRTDMKDGVLSAAQKIRNYIKNTLFSKMSYPSAATMSALVFGDRSYFTDEFYGNVKSSGVAHVMVVSGMHLSILVSLVLKSTERFIYNSRLRAVIMVFTVIALFIVCGFTKSILRAGITYMIMALGLILNRSYSAANALGGAVTFISIVSPFVIMNIGFQLSVLSTFGILAVAMPICDCIDKVKLKKVSKQIVESAVISLSAMLLTLPVIIHTFGYVSVVGVFTNLLISLPVNICLSATVIALILKPILPFLSNVILILCDIAVRYINFVIEFLGSLSFSTVEIGAIGVIVSVFLIFLVFKSMLSFKAGADKVNLQKMNLKILSERGRSFKWQSFLKRL